MFKRDQAPKENVTIFFENLSLGGHRGSPHKSPENTIASFLSAYEDGVDAVEFDVALSKDKIPIIIHDDTLDRTCNGTGRVEDYNITYLRTLDCGYDNGIKLDVNAVHRMPLLEDIVKFCKKRKLKMVFDIKDYSNDMINQLISIFEKEKIYTQGIVCSFHPQVLYRIKERTNKIITGYTWGAGEFSLGKTWNNFTLLDRTIDFLNILGSHTLFGKFLGADMLLTKESDITSWYVKRQKFFGFKIGAWTVNDLKGIKWLIEDLNVFVLTDYTSLYRRNKKDKEV
uniref:GP-PDE domain-containing protein n=1 Tax=Parastrongyloides trichosuri TaxID=131310 RepID=A0A0N4Z7P4_PARTI